METSLISGCLSPDFNSEILSTPSLQGSLRSLPNHSKQYSASLGTGLLGWGCLKALKKTAYLLFLSSCQQHFHLPCCLIHGVSDRPVPRLARCLHQPSGQPGLHGGRRSEAVNQAPSLRVLAVLTVKCNEIGS